MAKYIFNSKTGYHYENEDVFVLWDKILKTDDGDCYIAEITEITMENLENWLEKLDFTTVDTLLASLEKIKKYADIITYTELFKNFSDLIKWNKDGSNFVKICLSIAEDLKNKKEWTEMLVESMEVYGYDVKIE